MKKYILLSLISSSFLHAFEFHPKVGYEQVHSPNPTPHTKSRLIYGAGLLIGPPILSLEIEATTGQDTENFSDQNLTIKEKVYNGMLGLRSSFDLLLINFYVRAGGHVRRTETETTENGVTTKETPSTYVSPYAGGGLSFGPGPLKFNAGVTAIFTGRPNTGDVDYQYTLGASLGF